jgi:hypothetical protein
VTLLPTLEFALAWLLLLAASFTVGKALVAGEIAVHDVAYRRAREPSAYWFEILCAALPIAVAAVLLARLPLRPRSSLQPNPIEILWTLILMRFVAQALWHRRARFFGSDYPRAERRRDYWIIVLASALLCAGMTWLILAGLAAPAQPLA